MTIHYFCTSVISVCGGHSGELLNTFRYLLQCGRIQSGWPVIFGGRFYSGLVALTNSKSGISANRRGGSGSSGLALEQVYGLHQGRSEQNHTTSQLLRPIYLIEAILQVMLYPIELLMINLSADIHQNGTYHSNLRTTEIGLVHSRDPSLPSLTGLMYRYSEYLQGRGEHLKMTAGCILNFYKRD